MNDIGVISGTQELDPNKKYIIYLEAKDVKLDEFAQITMSVKDYLYNIGVTDCFIAPMYDGKPHLKAVELEKGLVPLLNEMGYDLVKKPKAVNRYQVKNMGKDFYVVADMEDRGLFLRDENNNMLKFTNKNTAYEYAQSLNKINNGENSHNA